MKLASFFSRLCSLVALLLLPNIASAQTFSPGQVLGSVGSWLHTNIGNVCVGACDARGLVNGTIIQIRPFIVLLAGLLITIQGFRMIVAQEDEIAGKAKTVITACISGIILMYLYQPFIDAFYGSGGSVWNNGGMFQGGLILSREVAGLIRWTLVIVAVLAITIIIVSGIQAIATAGKDEGVTNLRRTIIGVGAGIFLIILRGAITATFGLALPDDGISSANPRPDALQAIDGAVRVVSYIFGFLGLIALVIVFYAGILMVVNIGNEENATKAKALLVRAAIGLVVITLSLAIVTFVVQIA